MIRSSTALNYDALLERTVEASEAAQRNECAFSAARMAKSCKY